MVHYMVAAKKLFSALNDYYTPKVNMLLDRQVGVDTFYVIENKSKFLGIVDLKAQGFQKINHVSEKFGMKHHGLI